MKSARMSQVVQLRSGAWHGDALISLNVPAAWELIECSPTLQQPLTEAEVAERIRNPIGARPIADLAADRTSAVILVDDLSRPTPVSALLPPILAELYRGGILESNITIVVAGGTHQPDSPADIAQKLGPELTGRMRVIAHDCGKDLVYLGESPHGIPIWINQFVMAADLKIGVGAIYPHPAAGYSGGAKILAPAACGLETIRRLHDDLRPAWRRGGELETELRSEIEVIAERAGLDMVVNAVLNPERQVAELFAGHPVQAHRRGVAYLERYYRASAAPDADVVIADMYPFDLNLQFAYDRGLWPVLGRGPNVSIVAIAACPRGIGGHALYPVENSLTTRIGRRLRNFHPDVLRDLPARLRVAQDLLAQNRLELLVLSPGLQATALNKVFARAQLYPHWDGLLLALQQRHRSQAKVKVALYRCAPLMLAAAAYDGAAKPLRDERAPGREPEREPLEVA